jgi:hypothetical protein
MLPGANLYRTKVRACIQPHSRSTRSWRARGRRSKESSKRIDERAAHENNRITTRLARKPNIRGEIDAVTHGCTHAELIPDPIFGSGMRGCQYNGEDYERPTLISMLTTAGTRMLDCLFLGICAVVAVILSALFSLVNQPKNFHGDDSKRPCTIEFHVHQFIRSICTMY